MSSKKDMRRTDLVIPYVAPKDDEQTNFGSTFTSTMPMAAMFTRNKMLGWFSLLTALLSWLSETPTQRSNSATPGWLACGMAVMAVGVTYMPLFLPPPPNAQGSTTGAAAPVPA